MMAASILDVSILKSLVHPIKSSDQKIFLVSVMIMSSHAPYVGLSRHIVSKSHQVVQA